MNHNLAVRSIALSMATLGVGALLTACGSGSDNDNDPVAEAPTTLQARCEMLADEALPNQKFSVVEANDTGSFQATPDARAITDLPPFCRVAATLTPTSDSNIRVEVWMPEDWNGKFLGTGNGGLAGSIQYAPLAAGLKRGYAVANTDMGTSPSIDVMVGVPEKWVDYGHRSTHLMTTLGKQLVNAFYEQAPRYSYFHGCSTGGGQGFHEAQRYPEDYNGIIAGAPGNYRTAVHTSILWNYTSTRGAQSLSSTKLALLKKAAVAACDGDDGVVDGIISRPDLCTFTPETLQCTGEENDDCLTSAQVEGATKVYAGITNAVTGERYHDGLPPGSEQGGWNFGVIAPTVPNVPFAQLFQTVFGTAWTYDQFDFADDLQTMDNTLGPMVNAIDPDLRQFRDAGGKIIHFQGMADGVQPYTMSQKIWDRVEAIMPGQSSQFARLFNAPGMAHCSGGDGPNVFGNELDNPFAGDPNRDLLTALEAWVETDVAPDNLIATKFVDNRVTNDVEMTRPLCAYPKVLKYNGTGNPNVEDSFTCAAP